MQLGRASSCAVVTLTAIFDGYDELSARRATAAPLLVTGIASEGRYGIGGPLRNRRAVTESEGRYGIGGPSVPLAARGEVFSRSAPYSRPALRTLTLEKTAAF